MFKGSHTPTMHIPFKVLPMCGIIGYTGQKNAVPILIKGLKTLEYRGYDSSGISVFVNDNITTIKSKGRIEENQNRIKENYPKLMSSCGIGHTRWATHGEPSDINSHPHFTENISLVHNGIIENYTELRDELCGKGYTFSSETDTEAACILIDSIYRELREPVLSIKKALGKIRGSYAFGIIFRDHPGKLYSAKKDSPLICAKCSHGTIIASDITAILEYTNEIYIMKDGEIAELTKDSISFFDNSGKIIAKLPEKTDLTAREAEKQGYSHFMLKEIHEQPEAIKRTVTSLIKGDIISPAALNIDHERIKSCRRIHIAACGTAMHAGLIGKYFVEKFARIPVNVEIASEFRYRNPPMDNSDIFIAISQSGETADTLAALRLAKKRGLYTIAIVNAKGSTLSREADNVIYTHAGPEIAVASTKAYTVQCCTLLIFALMLGHNKGMLTEQETEKHCSILTEQAPSKLGKVFEISDKIRDICKNLASSENIFFIGRGIDAHLACEASLKLKEISYIHSEACTAGELKHGTISLINEGTPVIAIITESALFEKTMSNIKEAASRGADITIICDETIPVSQDTKYNIINVPHIDECLSFITASAAFQLLAYHTADIRDCDIDKPRNLAKSVTVE